MKILVIASTVDLKHKLACTPSWWQLLKAMKELGNDIIVIPYLGQAIQTPWWRTYDNPCEIESIYYNQYLELKKNSGTAPGKNSVLTPLTDNLIKHYIKPKWKKQIKHVLDTEKDIDAIFLMNVPVNHISGIPSWIKKEYGIPVLFYDGDMPTILPKYVNDRGFKFNYYENADLSEYDIFFSNSHGVISDLKEMGAKSVLPLHYASDPELFRPIDVQQDNDVFFYGYGNELREEWMTKMITIPSRQLPSTQFIVAGKGFTINLGDAKIIKDLPNSALGIFCCRSKINLNITRWSHASVYASSTTRLFELASLGVCIVSQPYNGINEWFDVGKDLIVVNSTEEAIEVYQWLSNSEEDRKKIGENARNKVLSQHTYKHRAIQVIGQIRKYN